MHSKINSSQDILNVLLIDPCLSPMRGCGLGKLMDFLKDYTVTVINSDRNYDHEERLLLRLRLFSLNKKAPLPHPTSPHEKNIWECTLTLSLDRKETMNPQPSTHQFLSKILYETLIKGGIKSKTFFFFTTFHFAVEHFNS